MAKEVINIGTSELSGDGETLRSALNKVNLNFTELYDDDALDFDGKFGSLTEKPTTLAGYGITDAATSAQGTKADNALQPTDISVSTLANAGSGTLTYVGDQAPNTGVLTYTPPDLSGLLLSNTTQVAIGSNATAGAEAVSIGKNAGDSGDYSQAIGNNAGNTGQGVAAVALGSQSGETSQGDKAVAVGQYAGQTSQGTKAVAIGSQAGLTGQGADAIGIGTDAGKTSQGGYAVAIGRTAGQISQSAGTVAIGSGAGYSAQGLSGIAIGYLAGEVNQGSGAIAIGANAGTSNQAADSIILNASNTALENTQTGSFVVKPVRNASGTHSLEYNPTTGEVTYDTGGAADTDALSEGTTNLYYTDARADARAQLKIDALVDTAPGTMDTLNELAAALGDDPNFATTTATSIAEKLPLAGGTMTGAIDMGSNNITTTGKMLFANMYATEGDLPSATTYHGMFAHVHGTGAGYFAHGGNWVKLANDSSLSSYQTTAGLNGAIDTHLTQSGPTSGHVLSWNGSDYAWVAQSGGGGGSQNLFSTVASSGQNDIVADGTTDKLYIEAGSGISITTDQNTDTLTITASGGGISNLVEDTTPQLGGDLDCQGFNITMDNGSISTTAGNLQLSSFNYVTMDSANNGQIEIGRSSGTGDVIIGKESNGTSVTLQGVASFDERVLLYKGAEEKYSALTGATGTVAHDCANGKMFYHTTPAADWTANFTNLNLNQYKISTSVGIVVTQGGTAYIPNAVQIGGAAQTIIWQGNSTPTGTANGTDAVSFTIMRDNATYIVLGQLTSFGGV